MKVVAADKLIDAMHGGTLEIHCVSVCVSQKIDDGLSLKGYGILKINQVGTLYLEFICLEASNVHKKLSTGFQTLLPDDPFDQNQRLYLEAVTLDGDQLFAEDFSVRISVFTRQAPYRINIFLHEVYFSDNDEDEERTNSYMYFEMRDKVRIPANKINTESNSYGDSSSSWNESEIKVEGATVNVIAKNDRVEVRASGQFDPDELYPALLFYLGLSSGVMPQPYCLIKRVGRAGGMYFKTIRKGIQGKTVAAPITEAASGKGFPASHYALLGAMLRVKRDNPLRFKSAYSQWQRMWHAFQSENNIAILTLSVAVEGLLNDIFIPELKLASADKKLEAAKVALIEQLGNIEGRDDHIQTLISSVERWGNIHAAKALGLLVDKELVLKEEKKAWGDLRNTAAHPTYKENNEASQLKEQTRIYSALTLFYRLLLNIFSYDGPMYEFRGGERPAFIKRPFVKVLDLD